MTWNHTGRFREKSCRTCGSVFKPQSGAHLYCSTECGFEPAKTNKGTDSQYKLISGNWVRYLSRLLYVSGRKRIGLTRGDLLFLLEKQNYRCAISGEALTCVLEKGTICLTNASVDQIIPNGGYQIDNIRLVCRAANIMKWTMSDKELHDWCRKILKYGESKSL